ncbi:MAG: efflux RND transporter permease subunit [Rhodothermales bacterium]|nr:efflux RND transporter permease subunit [Rhodothermales bacterium]
MKLVDISTRRRVTIGMFTLASLIFGFVSLSQLKINLLPDLAYPTLTVRTEYVGAAPVEIENLITKPIEEALGVVKNVQQLRSVSRTGQSDVVLEFAWGTNMDLARQDLRENLDALVLPLDAERPLILRFDPSLDPIMRYGLYEDTLDDPELAEDATSSRLQNIAVDLDDDFDRSSLTRLRRLADEQIKKELESALGVAAVKISGGLEDEVQVLVDQQRLAQLGLEIEAIGQVLGAENVNLSGGRLEEGQQQFLVRTINQFQSVEQIANVIIDQRGGTPVYLRDIASVGLGHKERESITRIDGREAVEIAIYKEGDANTVAVSENIAGKLERVNELLPDRVKLINIYDESTFINSAVSEVVNAGLIGGILAILILYLFLRDFKTTIIIGLSIPVSVIATFALMYWSDLSLNIMSLGGLALGIGLLVDNSIVVLENIARHKDLGKNMAQAAHDGASEVGTAVIAATLTTVAVFFPLVFVQGIAGQLFRDQALTVTYSLLASLLVALTLIPMLASLGGKSPVPDERFAEGTARTRLGNKFRSGRKFVFNTIPAYLARLLYLVAGLIAKLFGFVFRPIAGLFNLGYDRVAGWYPAVVTWALERRAFVLIIAFGLFLSSLGLSTQLGLELIPQMSQGEMLVEFRMPPGTPLEQTDAAMAQVQSTALTSPSIRTTFAAAGSGNRLDANPDEGGENWGELFVALADANDANGESEATATLRRELEQIPGLQYKFGKPTLFSFRTPIEVEISGYDLIQLKQVSDEIGQRMRSSDRFADVKTSMESGHPEVQILFDRERASALGLKVHDIADRIVSQVRGDVATKYSWRDRKIDVLVRAREEDRASIDRLRRLVVNPESERPVTLDAVARIVVETGPGEIRRANQQRVALINSNLNFGDLGTAMAEIESILAGITLPAGTSVRLAGQSEEMTASFRSLILALLLAVFLVYLVMASQFESLVHPLVIFFSIPLAGIGAILALWVTGSTVSVVVFIGLILLAGIVVNNAIVLVDLINKLREDGTEKTEAIVEAGRLRLRPILMTTLTTTLGLIPLAIGFGDGAEVRAPMAITVIGGLVVSTLLTLVVIPVMYSVLDRKKMTVIQTEVAQ